VHAQDPPLILRHWLGRLLPGREPALLARLRDVIPAVASSGLVDFTYGFRHDAGRTSLVALSDWPDFDAVAKATDGHLDRSIRAMSIDDLFENVRVESYERLPPDPMPLSDAAGRVLGVVVARVKPQHEATAQAMVDRSAHAALDAGALAAHLGRRLVDDVTEMLVVVVWPKREAMARFVRSRDIPVIDPAFAAHLLEYRFETYNALSPERLLIPNEGPAVLVIDGEGRYIDATPAVEGVLGIPPELLYGRSLLDLGVDEAARADLARRFLGASPGHGYLDLRRPDGRTVRVSYRSAANTPGLGLHASVLALAGEPVDRRPLTLIVAEALGMDALEVVTPSAGLNPTEAGA
jgi:PAS domain-containing protein